VVAHVDRLAKEGGGYAYSTTNWVVDRSYEIRAGYVLGTDGHRSAVRRNLGVDYADLGGRAHFGVFELGADTEAHEVRVVIDDDTTNVLWPLGDGRFRWSFQLADDWQAVPRTRTKDRLAVSVGGSTYPYLDEERLRELLAERAPWFDVDVEDVTWSIAVRFERRLAGSFGHGRVWLAGDSAHMTGPVGVQSMNVGFREADRLARAVTAALGGIGDGDLLEAYSRESRREWLQLLGVEGGIRAGGDADDWVRRRAERILPCVPASGEPLRRLLRQLGLELG
jgi:pentachlorophenol monooxygenase